MSVFPVVNAASRVGRRRCDVRAATTHDTAAATARTGAATGV